MGMWSANKKLDIDITDITFKNRNTSHMAKCNDNQELPFLMVVLGSGLEIHGDGDGAGGFYSNPQ